MSEKTISRLMGKFKNGDWVEIERTNPDSDYTLQEQQEHLMSEWKTAMGQAWMLKWVDD